MQIQWCDWGVSKCLFSKGDGCFAVSQVAVCEVWFWVLFFFFFLSFQPQQAAFFHDKRHEVSFLKSA